MLSFLSKLKTELNVGMLIIVGIACLVYASIQVTKNEPDLSNTYKLTAYFDNVSGLALSTAVKVAGIQVGEIADIELANDRAKVTLAISNRYTMYADTRAMIKSIGILGDVYVELIPGSSNEAVLKNNDMIQLVNPSSTIDQMTDRMTYILDDIRQVTKSLNKALGGKKGEEKFNRIMDNIERVSRNVQEITAKTNAKLDVILENVDTFTAQLSNITSENREQIKEMVTNFKNFSGELNELVNNNYAQLNSIVKNLDQLTKSMAEDTPEITKNLRGILSENRDNLRLVMNEAKVASGKLRSTMNNLDSITEKIDKGEGTIGKLLNDEETVNSINEALTGINNFIDPANKLKLDVGFQVESLVGREEYKSYVHVNIKPVRDHYYILKLVSGPDGYQRKTTTMIKDVSSDSVLSHENEYETKDDFTFTLMIAQRYFDTEFRLGLVENTAGFGIDQYFGRRDQFKISLDTWDFSREELPIHLRVGCYWRFMSNIYMVAGLDDVLNKEKDTKGNHYRTPYLGIGLSFNEDTLKSMIGVAATSMAR